MTEHRVVDPWTLPLDLNPGDRAVSGNQVMEWDGRRGILVCVPCDLAMTEWSAEGERECPHCGATERKPVTT